MTIAATINLIGLAVQKSQANGVLLNFCLSLWLVLDDLSVIGFIDRPGLREEPVDPAIARRHFGGTPAPVVSIALDADRAVLL